MKTLFAALAASLLIAAASAETQVFELRTVAPDEVPAAVRSLHDDEIRAEVAGQRLLVIGPAARLDEIAELLERLDQPPLSLRLTLRTEPPLPDGRGDHYATDDQGYTLESVEGALVVLDYSKLVEQPTSDGWMVALADKPIVVRSLTLQIYRGRDGLVDVVTSYTDFRNGDQHVLGNRRRGRIGDWLTLLPAPADPPQQAGQITYTTSSLGVDQLWLRVEPAQ